MENDQDIIEYDSKIKLFMIEIDLDVDKESLDYLWKIIQPKLMKKDDQIDNFIGIKSSSKFADELKNKIGVIDVYPDFLIK